MTLPLYRNHAVDHTLPPGAHAGLWWDKFYNGFEGAQWEVARDGKAAWIATVAGDRGRKTTLEEFAQRQYMLGHRLNAQQKALKTDWHFATGLGLPHPVENGFTWHPTLGVPYLTGAVVKGLLRAWVEEWQEFASDAERVAILNGWFGDQEQAGDLIFFDAIPVDRVKLVADVMTPHLGKWYEKGDDIKNLAQSADRVPSDWHSPVPVVFLAVQQATFLFQIAPRPNTQGDAITAMEWLREALQLMGAGAKTAAGYGLMSEDAKAEERLAKEQAKIDAKHAQVAETVAPEEVVMMERPTATSVSVKTPDDVVIACTGFDMEEAEYWWDGSGGEFTALVTRRGGVAVSAVWQEWKW